VLPAMWLYLAVGTVLSIPYSSWCRRRSAAVGPATTSTS
jgi:hypothetical protein